MEHTKPKLTAVMWHSHGPMMKKSASEVGIDMDFYSSRDLEMEPSLMNSVLRSIDESDAVLFNITGQQCWDEIEAYANKLKDEKKIVSVGKRSTDWALTSVDHDIAITAYQYIINNDHENTLRLLKFLNNRLFGALEVALPPRELPWYGIVHPDRPDHLFKTTEEYLQWYKPDPSKPFVGIVFYRTFWLTDGYTVESHLLRDLESAGANVIMFFSMSSRDDTVGAISTGEAIELFLVRDDRPIVDAIVKLSGLPIMFKRMTADGEMTTVNGEKLFRQLGIPVFQPVMAHRASIEDWENSPGLTGDIASSVALPEFEGVIEPIMLGSSYDRQDSEFARTIIPGRSRRLAERIVKRIELGKKPASEKKIAIFLNNYPCAGLEANVGAASHLDTHQSITNILRKMKEEGYDVKVPASGKDLIDNILHRKALSEFRWTTVQEIERCGGVVHMMSVEEYEKFFKTLSPKVQKAMNDMWGEPPGIGMVLDGKLMITGVSYGNVMISVQPKRGCYGARCDGEVCKILHDPLCPPTHQYLASYYYYEEIWGADAVVHVGTHGNLEFLPGKSVGMSGDCFPDICIGKAPHIYIYNADNPPEGTIAKRRSYATLIDHMQTVMSASALYGELEALDVLLTDHGTARLDPAQSHQLHHQIIEAAEKANLKELNLNHEVPLDECVRLCHEALSRIRNSQMNIGMHVFGELPEGDKRVEMINSILRYDAGNGSIRDLVAQIMGADLNELYAHQDGYDVQRSISNGRLLEMIGNKTRDLIGHIVRGSSLTSALSELGLSPSEDQCAKMGGYVLQILDVDDRISDSHEIESFLDALNGRYTRPGPSGLITRGRVDILPSGRNFYSMDPNRLPTTSAWRVGVMLADGLLKKYIDETGSMPENVAFFWMANDLLMADGEVMSQIFSLLGARPKWQSNGHVKDFEIIPLSEMTHPRIDVTVRTSGILRDNFMNCVDLLDSIVRAMSELDEPVEMNFVRKHTLESLAEGASENEATARFFSSPPGSYVSGVNLAVYASSWKDEKDLADIYVAANGYAYGNSRNGAPMYAQFASNLSNVAVTFNKIASDEQDLLGCCGYFSNQGGLTAAARHLSGKEVKTYYGDTREPKDINVHTLADELRRVVRTKLLNPAWIEGMKEHGYKGASDIMKRIGRVYGWEASTQEVDDWIFDDIATTFVNDGEMREFFQENNPYALEEISRRLLEAQSRGLWDADEEVLEELRQNYVEIESWLEERAGDGEYQGGSVDIKTAADVESWNGNLSEVMKAVHERMERKHGP